MVRKRPKQSTTRVRVQSYGWWHRGSSSSSSTALATSSPLPFTHLKLAPITGRTHQLRVHCAAAGYPIVGDPTYTLGGEASPHGGLTPAQSGRTIRGCPVELQHEWSAAYPVNQEELPMCLHAATLCLDHPVTNEPMEWHVPPVFPVLI